MCVCLYLIRRCVQISISVYDQWTTQVIPLFHLHREFWFCIYRRRRRHHCYVVIIMLFFRILRNSKLNIVQFISKLNFFFISLFEQSFNLNLFNVFTQKMCVCYQKAIFNTTLSSLTLQNYSFYKSKLKCKQAIDAAAANTHTHT